MICCKSVRFVKVDCSLSCVGSHSGFGLLQSVCVSVNVPVIQWEVADHVAATDDLTTVQVRFLLVFVLVAIICLYSRLPFVSMAVWYSRLWLTELTVTCDHVCVACTVDSLFASWEFCPPVLYTSDSWLARDDSTVMHYVVVHNSLCWVFILLAASVTTLRHMRLYVISNHAFPVAGSHLWSSLLRITSALTLAVFWKCIKITFFFVHFLPNCFELFSSFIFLYPVYSDSTVPYIRPL